jgi:hypothetical protein
MQPAAIEDEESLAAGPQNDIANMHPAWRRFVAASMALVFMLTLAAAGLLLCAA